MNRSRRNFLACAGLAPIALIVEGSSSSAQSPPACYDPAALTLADKSRRRSLGFVETSGDEKRRCGHCAFFRLTRGSCGSCQLMTNAPVTVSSVCNSFAPNA